MKPLPFIRAQIETLAAQFPTPFYIYDEAGIRDSARQLVDAFQSVGFSAYQNFFAVKALPNPHILQILREEKMGADCSSLGELTLAEAVGITGEQIMFTSNATPATDFQKAAELGALINFDDLTHLDFFVKHVGNLPEIGCVRYNPGALKKGNALIGHPEEAKYGMTRPQVFAAYRQLRDAGVTRFGLHTMVASNELATEYFIETAQLLFDLVVELSKALDITFEFVNLGGGIGIPYRPGEQPVDLPRLAVGIRSAYDATILAAGLPPLRVVTESGRAITGPHGYLVTRAIHHKETYKNYIGVDACMANLMRPGMYGAYHHISVLGKENALEDKRYDIVGGLCENNDKFAIDRDLPEIAMGDLLVLHSAGAHAHAMGFNYNAKLRSAEFLLKSDGSFQMLRRAETLADYFATLDFQGLAGS